MSRCLVAFRAVFCLIFVLALIKSSGGQTPPPTGSSMSPLAQTNPATPPDPGAEFQRARRLIQAGKFEEGTGILRQLAASPTPPAGVHHELGVAYYKISNYPDAITELRRALEKDPQDKEAVQLLGLSYFFTGHPAEAIPLLQKVQSWYPSANVDASYVLGICYIQTKNYDQARGAFAQMYSVSPTSAASHLFLARMLLRQGFDPIAEEEARKAVALDPKLPLAHFLLGELYTFKSQIPEAIGEFKAELAINPGNANAYYKLADAYTRVMNFEEAHRLLQRSIWLDPTSSGPFVLMGKVLLRKGEKLLAARTLQHALEMDPNNFMGHHLLGQAYREMGQLEAANKELKLADDLQAAQNRSAQEKQ